MSFRSQGSAIPRRSASTSRSSSFNRPRSLGFFGSTSNPALAATSYQRNNYSLPQSPSYLTNSSYGSPGSMYATFSQPYGLNYGNGLSSYGGTSSGYGSISVPLHSSLNSLNLATPNYSPSRKYHPKNGHINGKNYNPSYTSKNGNYTKNPNFSSNSQLYSTAVNTFESPKNYQPNTSKSKSKSSENDSGQKEKIVTRGRQMSRGPSTQRDRSLQNVTGGGNNSMGKRSLSTNSLMSEGYASGSERSGRNSRLGSNTSLNDPDRDDATENGELLDYKALWESAKIDNERLQDQLKKRNDELRDAKATIERVSSATSKNSLSELEKRERRAMERKLSEMEEELKQLDILKSENQRLKEENGALIRVISKLSK